MTEEYKCLICNQTCKRDGVEEWVVHGNRGVHRKCIEHIETIFLYKSADFNIENELKSRQSRVEKAESVIRGMFPMWIAAMSYCEHGRLADLVQMRNYYNGRDNPLTQDEISFMFLLIGDSKK